MSKIDDIDYLIGLVYEHLYIKIPVRPIESKPLSTNYLEDLTIVKKMYTGSQLKELINIIFNTNLSYLGKKEDAFKFKRSDNMSDILLRSYNKNQEMNPSDTLNVDKIIAYLLSDLVIHKRTNGIMINICNIDIPAKELNIFVKKYPEIKFNESSMISVTIREHFYKLVTLKEHLSKDLSTDNFKSSIFQVLHTLDVIQSMYPTFRHNNLTIDTIMVYETNEKTLKYKIGQTEFSFTSTGETKITNFLKSNMKDYIENNSLKDEPKMQEPNKYFDVNIFLESLMELELPKEIKEFIKRHEKDSSPREILLSDPLFKTSNKQSGGNLLNDTLIGGKKKKKSSKKRKSKRSLPTMSQEEVDAILKESESESEKETLPSRTVRTSSIDDLETPIEKTLDYLKQKNKNLIMDPVEIEKQKLANNQYMTEFNSSSMENKFPVKPIDIPGSNMKIVQPEHEEPIIELNLPKAEIPANSLGGLLGNPNEPSSGIMNAFGSIPKSTTWQLKPSDLKHESNLGSISEKPMQIPKSEPMQIPKSEPMLDLKPSSGSIAFNLNKPKTNDFNPPINVIPNPYKQINQGSHSILGAPDQNNGNFMSQMGGSGRIIPIYKGTKNSPYKSNEEKRTTQERYYEDNPEEKYQDKADQNKPEKDYSTPNQPYRGINLSKTAFEVKIAPELMPQPPMVFPKAQPEQIVKNYILPPPGNLPVQTYSIPNQIGQNPQANVLTQNTYNVSFASPSKILEFREDILPSKDESMLKYTMNTISERLIIYNYLRSILIRQNDGENINFLSDKSPEVRNLLSYLRIIDVQLTKNDKTTNNPLGQLPRRLIMYSSCYPIRVDRANYNVGCAKNNIGINIRIYQLIMGETFVNKYRSLPYKAFEVWREVSIYEQMRDNIIKPKLSPNFGIMYSYYITQDVEIDFLKINRIRNRDIVNKKEKEQKLLLNELYKSEMRDYLVSLQKYSTGDLTKLVDELDIHKPSNKCLIALTEAGTQDLISWSSRNYEDNGLAKKMINTGYHNADVWQSILFQMFQGFLSMYKFGIGFNNFDLNSNIMVKSLKTDEMNKGYWRYRVNGIDFYIPNYGYMVLINPDFADITSSDEMTLMNIAPAIVPPPLAAGVYGLGAAPTPVEIILETLDDDNMRKLDNVVYKSYSNELLVNQNEFNLNRNKFRVIKNMKDAFDQNVYNKEYTLNGGVLPDPKIMQIITDINTIISPIVNDEGKLLDAGKKASVECIRQKLNDDQMQKVIRAVVSDVRANPAINIAANITAKIAIVNPPVVPVPAPRVPAPAPAAVAAALAFNPPAYTIDIKNDLTKIMITKFKEFLHNRIGTSLKEGEQNNLLETDSLMVGELVACLDNRRWGIITNIDPLGNYTIYTVNEPAGIDNNIVSKLNFQNYTIGDLRRSTVQIEQISKPNQKLGDTDLLESYDLNF